MKLSWMGYLKALFKGKAVIEEAVKKAGVAKSALKKSSWKSSEFWFSVLSGGGAVLAQAGGLIPAPWGPVVLASSAFAYAISRGLAKSADPLGGVKPGITTTEFWINVLSASAGVLTAAAGVASPETAAAMVGAAGVAVSISRGLSKGGAQPK